MNTNAFDEFINPAPDSDASQDLQLNRLLAQAKWPEPDDATLARLQAAVASVLADPGDSIKSRSAVRTPDSRTGRHRWQRMLAAASVAVALLTGFLAGRWSTADRQSLITEIQPLKESGGNAHRPERVESSPIPDRPLLPVPSMAAGSPPGSKVPENSAEPGLLQPQPDPLVEKRRRLTQRERMQQQLDVVLACLEEDPKQEESCCRSLMPRRAEFEFLLGELIRSATGRRQQAAVTAMGFIGSDGSIPGLLQTASNERLRSAAVTAIKRCSSEPMLAALVLQSGSRDLAEEYVRELAHRSAPQAASAWLQLVQTPVSRDLCLRLADELSPTLVNILFAELDASLMDDRMAAILSLGRRDDEQTLKRVNLLCQLYPGRWEPVAILMWNGSPSAMKTLTALQRTPDRYAVLQTASVQLQAFHGQPPGP